MVKLTRWFFVVLTVSLTGCLSRHDLAPVVEHRRVTYSAPNYIVRKGDTLYSIAFRYEKDYQKLAKFNHLNHSYALHVGQVLWLNDERGQIRLFKKPYKILKRQRPKIEKKRLPIKKMQERNWDWPCKGKVVHHFSPQLGKKGIDIAGNKGQLVRAAREGVVAYSGSGLSGYGNLIIIKHEGQFLTAYGYNAKNLVSEGQRVKSGQVIADMGIVDRRFWGLHFEIRKAGQPVNPLRHLN